MHPLLIIILLVIAVSCARNGSYVYLYDCSGAITKFSVDTKERLASWQPTDMPGLADLVPLPIRDGCVLNNVRYDRARGRFVAVAPLEAATTADDTQRYTLLAIEASNMGVAAHATLPRSATIPNLTVSNDREIRLSRTKCRVRTSRMRPGLLIRCRDARNDRNSGKGCATGCGESRTGAAA